MSDPTLDAIRTLDEIRTHALECSQYMSHLPRSRTVQLLLDMQELFKIIKLQQAALKVWQDGKANKPG